MEQERTAQEYLEGTEIQTGACVHCGQIFQMQTAGNCADEQLDKWATEQCDCVGARLERKAVESEEKAKENIEKFFREQCPEAADLMKMAVRPVREQKIASVTVDTGFGTKGSVKLTSKGSIKVEKSISKKTSLEA